MTDSVSTSKPEPQSQIVQVQPSTQTVHPRPDYWARSIALAGIALTIFSLRSEICALISPPKISIELQDSPQIISRMGLLQLSSYLAIRSDSSREIDIRAIFLEIKSTDGSIALRLNANIRQIFAASQLVQIPFSSIAVKASQPVSEYMIFSEPILDEQLGKIATLEHELNRSTYEKVYPETRMPAVALSSRPGKLSPSNSAKVSDGFTHGVGAVQYSYTAPTAVPEVWEADERLLKKATDMFDTNFKLRPGSYTMTVNLMSNSKSPIATKKYTLTLLETQVEAIREGWSRFAGKRYSREVPPLRDVSLRIRSAD